jgi:xylulokinase
MGDGIWVLDFGTSYFKAAIVNPDGRMSRVYRVATPIEQPAPGRRELSPDRFQAEIIRAAAALAAEWPGGLKDVGAVSFSTQANTFILLDHRGAAISPFMVWDDARAKSVDPLVAEWAKEPAFAESSGLPYLNHQFTLAKLKWLSEQEGWQRVHRLYFLGDYFTHWATGEHVTDGSIAGLSGLFDVPRWRWSEDLCQRAKVSPAWLPSVVRSGTIVGTLQPKFAEACGLRNSCRFVAGCLDQFAGAIGVGNIAPGGCSETTGTVLATVRCADRFSLPNPAPIIRGAGPAPGIFFHMTVGNISANLLQFLREALPGRPSFESLDEAAPLVPSHLQLDHRAPLEELTGHLAHWAKTEPVGPIVRCIYETVAKALVDQVQLLFDGRPELIRCAGGAAKSRKWIQIKQELLGTSLLAPICPEPALLGAAALASGCVPLVPTCPL